jgi:LCP family protein required for cell wall assembly
MRNYSPTGRPHRSHHPGAAPAASFPATVTPDDPKPLRSSRPSGRPAPQPTGRPRGTTVGSGRGGYDPRFAGPILGGEVAIPTKRELRRAKRRRRSRGERLLRTLVFFVAFLLLMVSLGYGYFRYQWGQIASAPCATCVASANGAPYNVLLIGSDSRAGETAAQAEQFGTPTAAAGQRSDTIKIVHIDPQAGTASTLSIPRDTFVSITGLPSTSQLSTQNKINAAFSGGPDALVKTIENTFGIPISHYISISFFGVMDAVNALGGISLNFPYPGRDRDCSTGTCYNNSGLTIPTAGCQVLNGSQALSLSRSRYFQYYADGYWHSDPTSDLGRIQRQNLVISSALNKAKSTYNPLRLNSLLSSVVHDFTKDNGLSVGDLFGLAERFHAFSGSALNSYVLPTSGVHSSNYGDVEVVQADAAAATITQFLGGPFDTISTPPLSAYGNPITLAAPASPPTTAPVVNSGPKSTSATTGTTPSTSKGTTGASFDPTPC